MAVHVDILYAQKETVGLVMGRWSKSNGATSYRKDQHMLFGVRERLLSHAKVTTLKCRTGKVRELAMDGVGRLPPPLACGYK